MSGEQRDEKWERQRNSRSQAYALVGPADDIGSSRSKSCRAERRSAVARRRIRRVTRWDGGFGKWGRVRHAFR